MMSEPVGLGLSVGSEVRLRGRGCRASAEAGEVVGRVERRRRGPWPGRRPGARMPRAEAAKAVGDHLVGESLRKLEHDAPRYRTSRSRAVPAVPSQRWPRPRRPRRSGTRRRRSRAGDRTVASNRRARHDFDILSHDRVRHRPPRLRGQVAPRGQGPAGRRLRPRSMAASCGSSACTSRRGASPAASAATIPIGSASSSSTATRSTSSSARPRPSR